MVTNDEERAKLLFKLFEKNIPKSPTQRISRILEKISRKNDIPFDELGDDNIFKHESIDPEEGRKTYEELQRLVPGIYLTGLEDLPPYVEALRDNLKELKSQNEVSDNEYKELSNKSVNVILDLVNNPIKMLKEGQSTGTPPPKVVSLGNEIIGMIKNFEMSSQTAQRYEKNKNDFSNYLKQVDQENNDNCFIATLVYGSINHPQVILLRSYRDTVLSENQFGRMFIQLYYKISPLLLNLLRENKFMIPKIRYAIHYFISKRILKQ